MANDGLVFLSYVMQWRWTGNDAPIHGSTITNDFAALSRLMRRLYTDTSMSEED